MSALTFAEYTKALLDIEETLKALHPDASVSLDHLKELGPKMRDTFFLVVNWMDGAEVPNVLGSLYSTVDIAHAAIVAAQQDGAVGLFQILALARPTVPVMTPVEETSGIGSGSSPASIPDAPSADVVPAPELAPAIAPVPDAAPTTALAPSDQPEIPAPAAQSDAAPVAPLVDSSAVSSS